MSCSTGLEDVSVMGRLSAAVGGTSPSLVPRGPGVSALFSTFQDRGRQWVGSVLTADDGGLTNRVRRAVAKSLLHG